MGYLIEIIWTGAIFIFFVCIIFIIAFIKLWEKEKKENQIAAQKEQQRIKQIQINAQRKELKKYEDSRPYRSKTAFENNKEFLCSELCIIANNFFPSFGYEVFLTDMCMCNFCATPTVIYIGCKIKGYFRFPLNIQIPFSFDVKWNDTMAKDANTIQFSGNNYEYFKRGMNSDAFKQLYNAYMMLYEKEKKNSIGKEYVTIPYQYEYLKNCPDEIINWYEHMTSFPDVIQEHNKYISAESDRYCTKFFKGKLQLPFIPGSYYDDEGIHLAKFISTEYYKQTKKVIEVNFQNPLSAGDYGEYIIPRKLFFGYEGPVKILWNIYVPAGKGEYDYQEIDVLVITQMGIFCIECKNWKNMVSFRKIDDPEWYESDNRSFYNPILQNKGHINALQKYLLDNHIDNIPLYNIVCFLDKKTNILSPICQENMDEYEYKNPEFFFGADKKVAEKIKKLYSVNGMDIEQMDLLYKLLYPFTQFSDEKKRKIMERRK